jgi:methylated-DNA-protein-cysteine methyltransferase-like protein
MAESFHQRAIEAIKSIPEGRVASYGQIAAMAGSPRAARQVVRTLHSSSRKESLPWWRVINSKGHISLKPGQGFEEQKARLESEGVAVDPDGRIDLAIYSI